MSLTPLNVNTLGQFLNDTGLQIHPVANAYAGSSPDVDTYYSGQIVSNSIEPLVRSIALAHSMIGNNPTTDVSQLVYDNLIQIGQNKIPALGASVPSTYTNEYTGALTKFGFFRLFAKQAYEEFNLNNGSYADFLQSFATCYSSSSHLSSVISACNGASNYLSGTYSTMNDLITGDISGVSLSMTVWGTDLIASGKVIDLQNISKFGDPDVLLRTIYNYRAVTNSLNLALLSSGIPTSDLLDICAGADATIEQKRLIYAAFNLIVGNDLDDILLVLNCQTRGLNSLADLLNPQKLFPQSYETLTYPMYNGPGMETNSKTYYLIYQNGAVSNMDLFNLGAESRAYLPKDIAFACGAFRTTMLQIKNIHNMSIEKFAQVVTHMEPISDLTNIDSTNVPTDISSAQLALDNMHQGSNSDGTFNMCDFFGCISSMHYDWIKMEELMVSSLSGALNSIYLNMFDLLNNNDSNYNVPLQALIDSANAEIEHILATNANAIELNTLYNEFGRLLQIEQNARQEVLGPLTNITGNKSTIVTFIQTIGTYAQATENKGPAQVLEDIANTNNIGGSSLIASMREARNALKLSLTGAELENKVNSDELVLPPLTGTMSNLGIPIVTGAAIVPGSLAGSPETTLIPPNLSIFNTPSNTKAVILPKKAIEQVISCNCDCWIK